MKNLLTQVLLQKMVYTPYHVDFLDFWRTKNRHLVGQIVGQLPDVCCKSQCDFNLIFFLDQTITDISEMSSMQDYASCETLDSVSTLQGDSDTPELKQRPVSMVSSTGIVFPETDAAMVETENLIKNSYEAAVQALGTTGTFNFERMAVLSVHFLIISFQMKKQKQASMKR